jgi:hypothetical protein
MRTFRIGDVCVVHNQTGAMGHMNGEEVEVISDFTLYEAGKGIYVFGYWIRHPEHAQLFAEPHDLKKKQRMDTDQRVSWDDCAWRPHLEPQYLLDGLIALRMRML